MKSKTMYLEGVSQNSDSFLVYHGGVFIYRPSSALQWVSASKIARLDVGKTTSPSERVVFAWGANGHPVGSTNSRQPNAPNSVALLVAL